MVSRSAGVFFVASLFGAPPATAQGWPPEIHNLQFFPAETSAAELIPKMRGFAFALGVRCQHCHVGEEGQPLASLDFASDEKETKRNARVMLAIVAAINGNHLPHLAGDTSRIQVECVTCHRGTTRPEQLDSVLLGVDRDAGTDAALAARGGSAPRREREIFRQIKAPGPRNTGSILGIRQRRAGGKDPLSSWYDFRHGLLARYDALREEHHGSHTYNFAEETLVLVGEALLAEQNFDAAVAFFERNLNHFPKSTWTLGDLARAEEKRGNIERAIHAIERALELRPGHLRLTSQLEKLRQAQ